MFDPGDTLPASILQSVKTQAADRFKAIPLNSSWYFWFNVQKKPFNNLYARQAVLAAMDSRALSRLDSGFMSPDCHLIPFGIVGHSSPSSCPSHNPTGPPNTALAKQLMTYAIGRTITYSDMPAIRSIIREAAKNDYRLSSLVLGIANSAAFQMARAEPALTSVER